MPNRRPDWHLRVPEILETLKSSDTPPILDRACFERLFRLGRRQAIRLIAKVAKSGGYQMGKSYVVYREKVIEFLEGLAKEGKVDEVLQRRLQLLAYLNEARNELVAGETLVQPGPDIEKPAELPEGFELIAPGELQITYQDAPDLAARLAAFIKAVTKDYFGYKRLLEGEK